MCAPITVATGGAVGGCSGICQVLPQIAGLAAISGAVIWNFRRPISRRLSFRKASV